MSQELARDSSSVHIHETPSLNETDRLAKYIVSLLSSSTEAGRRLASAANGTGSSPGSADMHQLYLPNDPKLKKDEAIIHMYILFVLFCYVIGTGLIVVKYMRRETPFHRFDDILSSDAGFPSSVEPWIKRTYSCETLDECFSEDLHSPATSSSPFAAVAAASCCHQFPSGSQVTYV